MTDRELLGRLEERMISLSNGLAEQKETSKNLAEQIGDMKKTIYTWGGAIAAILASLNLAQLILKLVKL